MSSDRFLRQRLLPEVGDTGQQKLAEAAVRLFEGPGSAVAAEYLRRAGVGTVSVDAATAEATFPHAPHFRHAESAEVGHGAWLALDRLRSLLKLAS